MQEKTIPIHTDDQTIHQRFEEVASLLPDHTALRFAEQSMTYEQLDKAANQLAHQIIDLIGPEPGNVALFLENSIFQIVTILGILKAGKAYVALDTTFPAERNLYMLQDAQCQLLISNALNESKARDLSAKIQLILEMQVDDSFPNTKPVIALGPDDDAIIFYTSGSTGSPKGALQSHKNMVHFVWGLSKVIDIVPSDSFAYYLSVAFSAHAFPLLATLLNGGALIIYHGKLEHISEFKQWLSDMKISIALMIPSFIRHFQATFTGNEKLPDLRILFPAGETLYRSDVEKIRDILKKDALIINIYASSETYVTRAYIIHHDTLLKGNIVPIGYPFKDMEFMILDEQGKSVEKDSIGEFYIRSPYIMKGYWKRPELNASVIETDPDDDQMTIFKSSDIGYYRDEDCIVCVGRKDAVIKLRGYRIDLGEIENILLESKDVKEAACVLRKNKHGIEQIIAFIVAGQDQALDIDHIKALTTRVLPGYMLPSHFIEIDELPKNEIGKTAYKSIPEPNWEFLEGGGEKVGASNKLEEKLIHLFERVLKIKPIGITDDILKIGADSLSLFVSFNEIEKAFGKKLNMDTVLDNPTVEAIARILEDNQ
ncbi:MAG: non-ribosomal peptide synthetase [Bacteroidota bacterium]|nr:non-ribosomal peptide synthetase [Bacteroidota bacterium]